MLFIVWLKGQNGVEKRYVERMGTRLFASQRDSFFVDSGATYDGRNTDNTRTVTVNGASYNKGDTLTITSSYNLFLPPSQNDIGDAIILVDGDQYYRCAIISTVSATQANVQIDRDLPAVLQNTATTAFEVARNTISGLNWLEGKTVSILENGAVHPQRVVTGGSITLDRASSVVHVGLEYNSDLNIFFSSTDRGVWTRPGKEHKKPCMAACSRELGYIRRPK